MAFPQGIYFRATDNQTNPTNYDAEVHATSTPNYPRTSAQGNNVGWETLNGLTPGRVDRDTTTDVRLRGINQRGNSGGILITYRIDLPSTGTYNIRLALGDSASSQSCRIRFYDDETEFADIEGSTGAANRWFDATGVRRDSEALWVDNNATLERTFTSTIFRFSLGGHSGGAGNSAIAAVYIEAAGGGGSRIMFRGS